MKATAATLLPLLALLFPTTALSSPEDISIYIDGTHGDDANSGVSPSAPLRTLYAARDRIRSLAAGRGSATVHLSPGVHEVPRPLHLGPEDSNIHFVPWNASAPRPRLVGGVLGSSLALTWTASDGDGGIWKAPLPSNFSSLLSTTQKQLQAMFVDGVRMWRSRWPNVDHKHPSIFGGGYATATAGIGSIPCAFRSPHVPIGGVDCTQMPHRHYPGQPPTGLMFTATTSDQGEGDGDGLGPKNISAWPADGTAIVHASIYARPPGEGPVFSPGYVWIQGNLQYTLARTETSRVATDTDDVGSSTVALHFRSGGQQVNGYSWVLGAANIQNGSRFFVENVAAELDAPGEFYHDAATNTLYMVPPEGVTDPGKVEIVLVTTKTIISIDGASDRTAGVYTETGMPGSFVHDVALSGLQLEMTTPTFLDVYESPSRSGSDWTIHRGGTVFIQGAARVSLSDCAVMRTGGNGIFISNYAINTSVAHCEIGDVGDSAVAVMGDLQRTTGLGARNYPVGAAIVGNHIHDLGVYGKQVSGVFVAVSDAVLVSDNTFESGPSSAVKLNDGFIGGHVIQYNTFKDFVRETTDNGSINTHNRDRFYVPILTPAWLVPEDPAPSKANPWRNGLNMPTGMPRGPDVDMLKTNVIRGNLFFQRLRSGPVGEPGEWYGLQNNVWCIDMDDGNTRFDIFENVCVTNGSAGIKVGEFSDRMNITNNIVVQRGFPIPLDTNKAPPRSMAPLTIPTDQPLYNHNSFTRNLFVNVEPRKFFFMYAVSAPNWPSPRYPKPNVMDYNVYYAPNARNGMFVPPNVSFWQEELHLEEHGLFNVDPKLELGDGKSFLGLRVAEDSPALGLGFRNFVYGPRRAAREGGGVMLFE